MRMNTVLRHLRDLSKRLLETASLEQWEDWEHTAAQKKRWCDQLDRLAGRTPGRHAEKLIGEIRALEAEIHHVLVQKREETIQELSRIKQSKSVVHSYADPPAGLGNPERHFTIAC